MSVSDPPVVLNGDSASRRESNSESETNPDPKGNDSGGGGGGEEGGGGGGGGGGSGGDSDKELSALMNDQQFSSDQQAGEGEGEGEEETDQDVNFRSLAISPVPTPVLYRPETREMTRLSLVDTVTQVLNGYVHRRCPPDNKVIRLYVMGGFTGKSNSWRDGRF